MWLQCVVIVSQRPNDLEMTFNDLQMTLDDLETMKIMISVIFPIIMVYSYFFVSLLDFKSK